MPNREISLVCVIAVYPPSSELHLYTIESIYPFKEWKYIKKPTRFCDEIMNKVRSIEDKVFEYAHNALNKKVAYENEHPLRENPTTSLIYLSDEVFVLKNGTGCALGFDLEITTKH